MSFHGVTQAHQAANSSSSVLKQRTLFPVYLDFQWTDIDFHWKLTALHFYLQGFKLIWWWLKSILFQGITGRHEEFLPETWTEAKRLEVSRSAHTLCGWWEVTALTKQKAARDCCQMHSYPCPALSKSASCCLFQHLSLNWSTVNTDNKGYCKAHRKRTNCLSLTTCSNIWGQISAAAATLY